jgi:HTH-type transcriptional regulator, sugar sensing transcriptional regulator
MNSQLVEVLEKVGLNSKEAKVYLALVQAGQAQVSKIALMAKINRITTYDILDKLKKRGLVSSFVKNKIRFYNATKPDILVSDFEKRAIDLKNALPKFKEIMGEDSGGKIRHLEGLDGIKTIYLESLNSLGLQGDEVLSIVNNEKIREIWPDFEKEYLKKKSKKQIFTRVLAVDFRDLNKIKEEDGSFFQETRIVPKGFRFNGANILIFKGKLAIISLEEEPSGVVFESALIVQSFLSIFEMIWQFCGKGQVIVDTKEIKNKMFEPLSGEELARSIEESSKPLSHEKKDDRSDNLSLF